MQLLQPHYFEYWIKNQYLAYYLIDIVLKSKSWYRIALATATCAADLGILADDIIMGCDFSNLNYEIFLFLLVGKTNTEGKNWKWWIKLLLFVILPSPDTVLVLPDILPVCQYIYWLISNEWDAIAVVKAMKWPNTVSMFGVLHLKVFVIFLFWYIFQLSD